MTRQPTLYSTFDLNIERGAYTVGETEHHFIDICPMIYNHRVVLTPKGSPHIYDVGWCYPGTGTEGFLRAYAAVHNWDMSSSDSPPGYVKQVGSLEGIEV